MTQTHIRPFTLADSEAVIAVWEACQMTVPWNNPHKDITRKLQVNPELFLVAVGEDGRIVGTVMGGYEGHRGWINYLAVSPNCQNQGIGRALMDAVEAKLAAIGCAKINLQVRSSNRAVIQFYGHLGYHIDDVISLGKRLISDE